jgi:hypothetical protein
LNPCDEFDELDDDIFQNVDLSSLTGEGELTEENSFDEADAIYEEILRNMDLEAAIAKAEQQDSDDQFDDIPDDLLLETIRRNSDKVWDAL